MIKRTHLETEADEFDCELFRLLERAKNYSLLPQYNAMASPNWQKAYEALRAARPFIRNMMHEEDVESTS